MLRKLRPRSVYDVMAAVACFTALAGGTAYAANTIRSADIVDNEITTTDVRDDTLGFGGLFHQDLAAGSVRGSEIQSGAVGVDDIGSQAVGSDEVVNDSLLQSDIRAGAVTNDEVLDNSLTGADIDESSLNMSPTTTATFAGATGASLTDGLKKVASRFLPAGAYAVTATANMRSNTPILGNELTLDFQCELRNGGNYIGGALDRRTTHDGQQTRISLSMNGGANVPAGGGEVALWCRAQGGSGGIDYGQMMIVRTDGFF